MNFKSILPAIGLASLMLIAPANAASTTDQAVADIVKAQTKLHSLKSLTADIATVNTMGGKTSKASGTVKCLKPNYLWIETRGTAGHRWHISDGKDYCTNDPKGHWKSVKAIGTARTSGTTSCSGPTSTCSSPPATPSAWSAAPTSPSPTRLSTAVRIRLSPPSTRCPTP